MMKLFDAHADTPYELWRKKEHLSRNPCHIDLEKASAFAQYAQVFAFCSLAGTKWELSQTDFRACLGNFQTEIANQTKIKAYLSIEGAEVIGCDPETLTELRSQGFVMSTLTWNADNTLAGWHRSQKGLTEQGKDYVKTAQDLDILIDVSHLSDRAFWDLMKVTQKPIVASHSNCRGIWEHSRNLTDAQLRALAETGGAVGLNLYTDFLGEGASFETMRRHLEHMLDLCGERHVCLGGDLDGCDLLPEGFSDVSGYADFYAYLKGCGYSTSLLDGIFYDNLHQLIEGDG